MQEYEREHTPSSRELNRAVSFHEAIDALQTYNAPFLTNATEGTPPTLASSSLSLLEECTFIRIVHTTALQEIGLDLSEEATPSEDEAPSLQVQLVSGAVFGAFLEKIPREAHDERLAIRDDVAYIIGQSMTELQARNARGSGTVYPLAAHLVHMTRGLERIGLHQSRHMEYIKRLASAINSNVLSEQITAEGLGLYTPSVDTLSGPSTWHTQKDVHTFVEQWREVMTFLHSLTKKEHAHPLLSELLQKARQHLRRSEFDWRREVNPYMPSPDQDAYLSAYQAVHQDLGILEIVYRNRGAV